VWRSRSFNHDLFLEILFDSALILGASSKKFWRRKQATPPSYVEKRAASTVEPWPVAKMARPVTGGGGGAFANTASTTMTNNVRPMAVAMFFSVPFLFLEKYKSLITAKTTP
jgi:hypothetical protein